MSSFLRPRRGKQSTAASTLTASNPLKRGEIFFEVPTGGVGTGTGKLKMGDGSTAYANLPYFLSMDDSVVTFTDSSASSSWNSYSNYLANIKTGITLPTFFANTKNLLYQLCNKVTSINNDLDLGNFNKGGLYSGNIDSYEASTMRPGKGYYCAMNKISSAQTLPTTSGYGFLYAFGIDSALCQLLFRYNGSSKICDALYVRIYINHGWTAWSHIQFTK